MKLEDTMNDQDFELLSAYLDGELGSEAAAALEQRLAQEPSLREQLQRLEGLEAALRNVLRDGAGNDTVPPRVRELLQRQPAFIHSLPHRLLRIPAQARPALAVAASLVAVVALTLVPRWQQSSEPEAGDPLLATALETRPSRASGWDELGDGRRLRTLLSFPVQDGSWCREYLLVGEEQAVRAVACRVDGTWETRLAVSQTVPEHQDNEAYRTASAGDHPAIARFIDSHATGDTASKKREAGLIANGWQ